MRHALSNEPWQSLLPDTDEWLANVPLTSVAGDPMGAHVIVAAKGGDEKEPLQVNAPRLADATRTKLENAAKALGWKSAAGPLHLSIEGTGYTLVPLSSVKAGERQVARQFGLDAAKATKELKLAHVALVAADKLPILEALDGYCGGLYSTSAFKGTRKRDTSRFPGKITLAGQQVSDDDLKKCRALARAQILTRFMQDAPPNYLNPLKFAEFAQDVARDGAGMRCRILDKEAMTALGMGSFLSVADGGTTEPRTIVIEIEGHDNSKSVALVGKGLTFDSGGISLKPGAGMEEMKYDMSGGAAVLGTARYFGMVKPPVKVICVIGATENMPGNNATRPSDIVRAMNGKTIEILNTDAEGRLVLADVLHYAISQYKPDLVLDIATLTGAVLMALGCVGSAVMTNHQDVTTHVLKSADSAGEPMWQLPLWPELEKEVKSDIADLKNIAKGSVKGGTIIGGMFLKEFVGDAKWAHLDIAGTGWNCQALGYPGAGGSAFGLRTLVAACTLFKG